MLTLCFLHKLSGNDFYQRKWCQLLTYTNRKSTLNSNRNVVAQTLQPHFLATIITPRSPASGGNSLFLDQKSTSGKLPMLHPPFTEGPGDQAGGRGIGSLFWPCSYPQNKGSFMSHQHEIEKRNNSLLMAALYWVIYNILSSWIHFNHAMITCTFDHMMPTF